MDVVRGPSARNTTPNSAPYHRVLLRIIGAQRKRPDHRTTSYNRALEITRCQSVRVNDLNNRFIHVGVDTSRYALLIGGWSSYPPYIS